MKNIILLFIIFFSFISLAQNRPVIKDGSGDFNYISGSNPIPTKTINGDTTGNYANTTIIKRLDSLDATTDRSKSNLEAIQTKLDSLLKFTSTNQSGMAYFDTVSCMRVDTMSRKYNGTSNTLGDMFTKNYHMTITTDSAIIISSSSGFNTGIVVYLNVGETWTDKGNWDVGRYPNWYFKKYWINTAAPATVRYILTGE